MLTLDQQERFAMDGFLVAFEFGSGRVWGYVLADSEDHIVSEIPELEVHYAPPPWMTVDEVASLRIDAIPVDEPYCVDRLLDQRKARSVAAAS
ncbi:MAG: hypothetical protein ACE5GC_01525 [Acidimicrobiia bacterium]